MNVDGSVKGKDEDAPNVTVVGILQVGESALAFRHHEDMAVALAVLVVATLLTGLSDAWASERNVPGVRV